MEPITMYCTSWCPDCRRAKYFLTERGIAFDEINIEEDDEAEDVVMRVNDGKCKVPTFKVGSRFFALSPFNAQLLADELKIALNR